MVNGIYSISDDNGIEFNVYCDFTSEPNSVWTLIESFSLDKNELFKDKPFNIDFPYLEDSPDWDNYRLSFLTVLSYPFLLYETVAQGNTFCTFYAKTKGRR